MSNSDSPQTPAPVNQSGSNPPPGKLHQIETHPHDHHHKTELEKWAVDAYNQTQVLMDEQGNRVMLWVSLILLLLAAIIFYNRSSKAGKESSWISMFTASSPAQLKEVAETNTDDVVGALASVREGEMLIFASTENMFKDRETSKTELADAQKAFERTLKSPHLTDEIKQRAELGLATVTEMQSEGDLSKSLKAYEELASKYPDTPIGNIAKDRVAALKENKDAADFYAWFSKQNPKPPVREEPKDNTMPSVPIAPELPGNTDLVPGLKDKMPENNTPDFLKDLEKLPKVEGKTEDKKSEDKNSETKKEEMKTETPKTETPPAKEEKPAADKQPEMKDQPKAETKPAEPAKKEEPKPADSAKPEPEKKPESEKPESK